MLLVPAAATPAVDLFADEVVFAPLIANKSSKSKAPDDFAAPASLFGCATATDGMTEEEEKE